MDRRQINANLQLAYEEWKVSLEFTDEEATQLSPPLLLSVTNEYCAADKRIIVFGQETYGWEWNKSLKEKYPDYPENWKGSDINTLSDFIRDPDSVKGLCWAYNEFNFAKPQKANYNSLFWRAFREVAAWPGAGVMWSNVSRCDYTPAGVENGNSILSAPEELREKLVTKQKKLFLRELEILKPDACVFFIGPYYDPLLTASLPDCKFLPCSDQAPRVLAQVADASLPQKSFRTYHPNYLNRNQAGKWAFIGIMKANVYSSLRPN